MSAPKNTNKSVTSAKRTPVKVKDLGTKANPIGGRRPGKAALAQAYNPNPGSIQY